MSRTHPKVKRIKWPNNIIKDYTGFVVKMALKYVTYHSKAEVDDLVQEGNLALLKAWSTFDDSLGIKYLTHAGWWIKAYMFCYLHSQLDLIYVPTYKRNTKNKITHTWNKHTTDAVQSFDSVIAYGADGDALTLESLIHDNGEEVQTVEERQELWSKYSLLEDKHANILQQYFGTDKISPHTFDELGKTQGVSRQCAEQRLKIAVKKLRAVIARENLKVELSGGCK